MHNDLRDFFWQRESKDLYFRRQWAHLVALGICTLLPCLQYVGSFYCAGKVTGLEQVGDKDRKADCEHPTFLTTVDLGALEKADIDRCFQDVTFTWKTTVVPGKLSPSVMKEKV